MSEETTTTSLKEIFGFPFRGPGWQGRFIVGAALILASYLFFFVPLLSIVPWIFVAGYAYQIMRRAAMGEDLTLPAWDNWGQMALDGVRGFVVSLVFTLPALVCFVGGMLLYYVLTFAMLIPMGLMDDSGGTVLPFLVLTFGSMAIMFLSMFVGWLLMLLGLIPLPMATAHFIVRDELSAAFRLREVWSLLKANKLGYFIAWVVIFGLGAVLYFVLMLAYSSVVLCAFIPFLIAPISFYVQLVWAALFGRTYRESVAALGTIEQEAAD